MRISRWQEGIGDTGRRERGETLLSVIGEGLAACGLSGLGAQRLHLTLHGDQLGLCGYQRRFELRYSAPAAIIHCLVRLSTLEYPRVRLSTLEYA